MSKAFSELLSSSVNIFPIIVRCTESHQAQAKTRRSTVSVGARERVSGKKTVRFPRSIVSIYTGIEYPYRRHDRKEK